MPRTGVRSRIATAIKVLIAAFIKVNRLGGGCEVFTPSTGLDGGRRWMSGTGPAPVAEPDADAYIARQRGYDPDLWVIEIEDRDGRHFLDDPVD